MEYRVTVRGCWIPKLKSMNDGGYPIIYRNGKKIKLSRFMYEKVHGPILDGMIVRHKCDNHLCINPEHLEMGTQADNMQDKKERGRAPSGSAHFKAILSDNERAIIIGRRESGMTIERIAIEFGVGYGVVERVLKAKGGKNKGIIRIKIKNKS